MSPPSRLSLSPDLSSDEDYNSTRNGRRRGKEPSEDNEEDTLDYAAHMEEIFSEDEEEKVDLHDSDERHDSESAESEDDEGFIYTGVDSEPSAAGYRAQLADVLEGEQLPSDEESVEAGQEEHPHTDTASHRSSETRSLKSADESQEVRPWRISHCFNATKACSSVSFRRAQVHTMLIPQTPFQLSSSKVSICKKHPAMSFI